MKSRSSIFLVLGTLIAAAAGYSYARFRVDVRAAEARVASRSRLVATREGQLEYAVAGTGPPLLIIHGTGGGFDQGLTFTEGLRGFQIIAPSRFGYLRTDFPDDPSSERQADAFAELLDQLHIDKLAVAGGSAGALSAVQFAVRYPERTTALILLVPAANLRGRDPVKMTRLQEILVRRVATSDFLFWAALKTAREQMIGTLLATDPGLLHNAPSSEKRRADRILQEILPVSYRWRGMLNDARLASDPAPVDFSKIQSPTLVISVDDDRFGTASTARDIAAAVPRSKLVIYPHGGHIWLGHDADLWREVAEFLHGSR